LVQRAQALGVPMGRYNTPADVLADKHEKHRELFQPVEIPGIGKAEALASPFHFSGSALHLRNGPPRVGQDQDLLKGRAAAKGAA
jgi:crotonobetainyl-CoA:carnitine CoA-transferase CaiB-like acyl-CoA transferase